jgi:hypothetical protein
VNLAGAWTATSASEVDGSVTLNTDGNVNTAALTGGGAITVNIVDGIDVTGSGTVVTLSNAETYDVIGDQNAGNYANITGDSVVGYFANDTVQGATSYVSDPSGNGAILSTSGTDLYDTAGDYWFVGDPNAPVGAAATNPLNNVLEVGAGNALAGATDSNIFNIQTVQSTATGVSVNVQHLSSDLTLDAGIGSDTVTAGTGSDTVLAGKSDVIGLGNQGANNDTVVFGASGTGGTASGSTVTISGLHVGDVVSDSAANLVTGGEHAAGKSGSTSWAGIDSHGNVTAWQGSVTTTSAAVTEIINSFRETGGVTQGDYSFFNLSGKEYLYIAGTTGETTSGSSDSLIQLTGVSTTETHSVSGGALTLTHL